MARGVLFVAYQSRFRGKRFREFEKLVRGALSDQASITILDAGGRGKFWELLPADLRSRVKILVLNLKADFDIHSQPVVSKDLNIEYITGNACKMTEFGDASIDIVHSNSVIEHVGGWSDMSDFADEVRRVGRAYYVQTPSYWFPIEPHYGMPFFHWLPEAMRINLHTRMRIGYQSRLEFRSALETVDHHRMLDRKTFQGMFPDGRLVKEKLLLFTKSFTVIREFPANSNMGR